MLSQSFVVNVHQESKKASTFCCYDIYSTYRNCLNSSSSSVMMAFNARRIMVVQLPSVFNSSFYCNLPYLFSPLTSNFFLI